MPQAVRKMLLGHWIVTTGTGRTVTVNLQSLVPQALLATQFTIVVPIGKHVPEGGVQPTSTPLKTTGAG